MTNYNIKHVKCINSNDTVAHMRLNQMGSDEESEPCKMKMTQCQCHCTHATIIMCNENTAVIAQGVAESNYDHQTRNKI